MKKLLFLLSFLLFFVSITFSQCTNNVYGLYGNLSPVCGNGVNGAWTSITWAYSREYSTVNVVAGNTYEFQSYVTSGGANRFTTITTLANTPLVWGVTNTITSVTWTANFTGQVRFWTHLNTTCGSNTNNSTRRVRCNEPIPPCVGTLVTLNMNDSYGDGWNGAEITISGNLGTTYGPYTLNTGFSGSIPICLPDDCYSVNITSGSWPGEISWSITNGSTSLTNGGAPVTLNNIFSIGSANCSPPTPGPCINSSPFLVSSLPTQSNSIEQLLPCSSFGGQFTDEYSEWTGGVAGTDYTVFSSVSTDWITITSVTPNGTVVAFGNSPLIWTAPTNGTYFIHVSTDGFCGEDFNCRDITVERISVLPVTLTSFTTECDNGIPILKWTTESEQNSDYFQIERSRDGFDWIEVSKVQAMGNSNTTKNYQFYDMTSGYFEGYYRLKQVDFDGKFEYFGPVSSFCSDYKDEFISEVFPNPTSGEIFVGIRNNIQENVNMVLTDFSGRVLKDMNFEVSNGYTLRTIDLLGYSSGSYLITIITNNNKYVHKITLK
jgi:hypothetical protein